MLVVDDVKDLVAILKFLKPEEPGSFLLPLLHHICKSFPAAGLHASAVTLSCPGHAEPRTVSFPGFLLLEEAESSFETSIQSIEKIDAWFVPVEEPQLSALSSRMMRQEKPVASVEIDEIRLGEGLHSAQAFSSLLQADQVDVRTLVVSEAIGEEGWRILARIPDRETRIGSILVTRDGLAQGKKEDIKHLFDAGCEFQLCKTLEDLNAHRVCLYFGNYNKDWTYKGSMFERMLDMSETEFNLELERWKEPEFNTKNIFKH